MRWRWPKGFHVPPVPRLPPRWTALAYDPKARAYAFQALLLIALFVLGYEIVTNTATNLK
jgi:ABC-type amino acid transport system permease subunit